jgi:hypothetical protein
VSDRVGERLAELRNEYRTGEEQLRRLLQSEVVLRETLLRISGAIQVLEELDRPAARPGVPGPDGAAALSVG